MYERLAPLFDEIREAIVSELAMYGGIEGIELAASLARADPNAKVQADAIGSLFLRRADRVASDILRSAPGAAWSIVAEKGYVDKFADADVLERLRSERRRTIDDELDAVKKLGMILRSEDGLEPERGQIAAVLKSPEFPVKDQRAGWTVAAAFRHYPKEVASAFVDRLENGRELPFSRRRISGRYSSRGFRTIAGCGFGPRQPQGRGGRSRDACRPKDRFTIDRARSDVSRIHLGFAAAL